VKILVTFALENEFAPWRAMHDFRDEEFGTASVSMTEINGAEIAVLITGAGPEAAGLSAANVIWGESESIRCCISSGLAGALRSAYGIGQVLAARRITTEGGRSADARDGVLDSSSALVSFAEESGATIVDRFYTAQRAISRADEKRYLGKRADAVDMESFEIVLEAQAFGVPAIAIRAISDGVDEDLPLDMNRIFSDEGQLSIPRVVGQVALHPQSLPGLVKLGQQSKKAAGALAQFLDRYIARIAASAQPIELKAAAQ
jgi:adenosylhomocysteine nucleosidase